MGVRCAHLRGYLPKPPDRTGHRASRGDGARGSWCIGHTSGAGRKTPDRNLPLRIAVDLNAVFGFGVRGDIIADGDRGDVGDARSAATAGRDWVHPGRRPYPYHSQSPAAPTGRDLELVGDEVAIHLHRELTDVLCFRQRADRMDRRSTRGLCSRVCRLRGSDGDGSCSRSRLERD